MRPPPPSRPNGGRVPRGPHPPPVTALCFRPWGRACPGPFAPAASPRPASRVRLGAPHGVRQRRPHRRCDRGSFRGGSFRGRRALSPAPPWVCPSVADLAPQAPAQASVWVPVPLSPPPGAFRGAEPLPGAGPRRVRGPGFPTSGGHSLRPGLRLLLFVPRPPWWVRGGVTGAPGDATSAPFRGCVGICVSPSGTRPLESLSVLRGYLGFSQQTAAQRSTESFIHSLIHSFSPSSAGRRA